MTVLEITSLRQYGLAGHSIDLRTGSNDSGEVLRRTRGRCCTRYMILRSLVVRLALGAVWFVAVALTFLVIDLYT
ncbi:hypothetical protein KRMM14A1004_44930 [Krasilnikovia sp. MM14-A1004]